jgi:hypothetical protein
MICSKCGGHVTWRGPFSALTHTECENCGAINSQQVDDDEPPAERDTLTGELFGDSGEG